MSYLQGLQVDALSPGSQCFSPAVPSSGGPEALCPMRDATKPHSAIQKAPMRYAGASCLFSIFLLLALCNDPDHPGEIFSVLFHHRGPFAQNGLSPARSSLSCNFQPHQDWSRINPERSSAPHTQKGREEKKGEK